MSEGMQMRDFKRILSSLRSALGWSALIWLALILIHLGLRHWILQSRPEFVLKVWSANLAGFLQATLHHVMAMRLVFLLLATGWFIAWRWERRL